MEDDSWGHSLVVESYLLCTTLGIISIVGVQYVLDGHIFLKTQIEKEIYMTASGRMINIKYFHFFFLRPTFSSIFFLQEESINLGEKREKKTTYLQKERALTRSKSIRCYLKRYEINTNLSGVLWMCTQLCRSKGQRDRLLRGKTAEDKKSEMTLWCKENSFHRWNQLGLCLPWQKESNSEGRRVLTP